MGGTRGKAGQKKKKKAEHESRAEGQKRREGDTVEGASEETKETRKAVKEQKKTGNRHSGTDNSGNPLPTPGTVSYTHSKRPTNSLVQISVFPPTLRHKQR